MNRKSFTEMMLDCFSTIGDHPFEGYTDTTVFRHENNKKWFALLMNIPAAKLGLNGGDIDVVNLKCAPDLLDSLWQERGIFPAYHMNKAHWITVALDGSVSRETLKWLVGISYDLTKKKTKKTEL